MAVKDIKRFLFEKTGVAESKWRRTSKRRNTDGSQVRIFHDKSSGMTVETVEKDGVISMVDSFKTRLVMLESSTTESSLSDEKKALAIIKKYFKDEDSTPEEDKPGFSQIPKHFKFSFLEDSNVDHTVALVEAANASNSQVAVTGFSLFFSPKFKLSGGVISLAPLLEAFLPHFLTETEEAIFTVYADAANVYDEDRINGLHDGSIPIVPYDQLVATLEKAGFTYDIKNCMLASLGGSKGAKPFDEEKSLKEESPKFCMIMVKNPMYEEGVFYYPEFITALIVDSPKATTREEKKKLINKTLKSYGCHNPGRLMNNMLPQIELFQIARRSGSDMSIDEKDREKVFNLLTEAGWQEDLSLASEENAKKWTLEEWAVTPMNSSHGMRVAKSPKVSDHESKIEYLVWRFSPPKLKP